MNIWQPVIQKQVYRRISGFSEWGVLRELNLICSIPTFVFHPSGITVKKLGKIAAHMVNHFMTTKSLGNC